MAEIPSIGWIAIGVLIGVTSLFLGFINPVEKNLFFQLMTGVAVVIILFGFLKMQLSKKSRRQKIEEHRAKMHQRGEREAEINIDDYRNNPQLREEAIHRGQQSQSRPFQQHTHHKQASHGHQNQGHHAGYHGGHHTQQVHAHQHTQHRSHHRQQVHAQAQFCSQCGSPLMKNAKFCPLCGNRV